MMTVSLVGVTTSDYLHPSSSVTHSHAITATQVMRSTSGASTRVTSDGWAAMPPLSLVNSLPHPTRRRIGGMRDTLAKICLKEVKPV
jgi:hypothetical protein